MSIKGKVHINVFGIIFLILVIGWVLGKTSFWHIVLLPFYALGACFGLIFGIMLLIAAILLIMFIIAHFSE